MPGTVLTTVCMYISFNPKLESRWCYSHLTDKQTASHLFDAFAQYHKRYWMAGLGFTSAWQAPTPPPAPTYVWAPNAYRQLPTWHLLWETYRQLKSTCSKPNHRGLFPKRINKIQERNRGIKTTHFTQTKSITLRTPQLVFSSHFSGNDNPTYPSNSTSQKSQNHSGPPTMVEDPKTHHKQQDLGQVISALEEEKKFTKTRETAKEGGGGLL